VPNPTLPIRTGPVSDIETGLATFLGSELLALGEIDPSLAGFADVVRDLTLAGGKRIRPTFATWGYLGAGGGPDGLAAALPALAALELLHTFALIHDDVMDRSALRRGRPTAHERYAREHAVAGWRGPADQYGTAAAILAGDLSLVWADRLIAQADLPPDRLAAARRVYDAMRVDAISGQYLDVLGEAAPSDWTGRRALTVARYKTASYTVRRPLEFGAALAGAEPAGRLSGGADETRYGSVLTAFARYGDAVGEAFQLRDDLLGVYGDPALTGKPAGDDLRRGKPTPLLLVALRRADPAQRRVLRSGVGDPDLDDAAAARLADLITRTGARRYVEGMIGARVRRAVRTVHRAPLDPEVRDALVHLAEVATSRQA
jgi:geranylgeranyl diphosphate synthase type I